MWKIACNALFASVMAFVGQATFAQSGGSALDKICVDELAVRTQQAKKSIQQKDFEKAHSLLEPCSLRLKAGSEGKRLLDQATAGIQRSADAIDASTRKRELAQWRKEGVSIGMTAERVRLSMWGKPQRINTTTNAYGVREQWVYGGGNYLYFQDGILTSIQN